LRIVASVIARLGSKRLAYKNLLPYQGVPLVLRAIRKLKQSEMFDEIVLSTESELIARTCIHEEIRILRRPRELSGDEVGSIPVFQHIVEHVPCDIHLNYNCNFPECDESVFEQALTICQEQGEALSVPYAVWAQTRKCLDSYGDSKRITATQFKTDQVFDLDIHTVEDLITTHQSHQVKLEF
jgi:CMP-2-keto-3-deoxyoctulosonic acid synthetase|tara:strand:- start:27 stop:575 length:549 start_codon:yes stop_codon:yes gene_type:complete